MTNPFETIEARLINIERLLLDIKHNRRTGSFQINEDVPVKPKSPKQTSTSKENGKHKG